MRTAAAGRDKASGKTLLGNRELLDVILEWMKNFMRFGQVALPGWRAKAPRPISERRSLLSIWKNLFNDSGPLWTARWCCGLGLLPPGITTFAPNSIEVQHRVLKGLLAPGYSGGPLS